MAKENLNISMKLEKTTVLAIMANANIGADDTERETILADIQNDTEMDFFEVFGNYLDQAGLTEAEKVGQFSGILNIWLNHYNHMPTP